MLLHCNPDKPNPETIAKAVEILGSDGIIIYPTDTVYGMGCDMINPRAFERLCKLTGQVPEKANPSLICHDLSHLSDFTKPISNHVFRVMKKALPGPYTFILPCNNNIPKIFRSNKKTIGIRVPDNSIVREIVKALGNPILNMSVHDPGDEMMEYTTDPEIIHNYYGSKVDLVISGGFGHLAASTVLDCTGEEIVMLRQGLGEVSW